MVGNRFDSLIRSLAFAVPRRTAIGIVFAACVAMLPSRLAPDHIEAKRKKPKKKSKKVSTRGCASGTKACGGACIPQANCCTNANCRVNAECIGGACPCRSGFDDCQGACIPVGDCCTDDDCPAEVSCSAGQCVCPNAGERACGGTCKNVLTDPVNCGGCGTICATGGCVNGACTCNNEVDCPGSGCTCGARFDASGSSCYNGSFTEPMCGSDSVCPVGSFCSFFSGYCTQPCEG